MNLSDIITKCYILALIIRDDGERLLLGDGTYEFKSNLQHFAPNIYQNDVVELQGTDGQLLAGQVRRSATQAFDGYIADGTIGRTDTEQSRRRFLGFFRKKHHYKVVYIMPDGTAVQRDRGYIVDAPAVQELYQRFPEYHIGLNFEDPNYYEYDENGEGEEIPANTALISLANLLAGGLVWDNLGAVSQEKTWLDWENGDTVEGFYQYTNGLAGAPLSLTHLYGNATQGTTTGKNLMPMASANLQGSDVYTDRVKEFNISLPINTYVVSFNLDAFTLGSQTSFPIHMRLSYDNNNAFDQAIITIYSSTTTGRKSFSFTTTRVVDSSITASNIRIGLSYWNNGARATLSNIQIEAGSTASDYEIYTGGSPMPNPQFPSPVETVTGAQTVKITGKNLFKTNRTLGTPSNTAQANTTKRLFDFGEYVAGLTMNNYYAPNFITSQSVSDNTISVEVSNSGYGLGFPIETKPSTSYTVSFTTDSTANDIIRASYYATDGSLISWDTGSNTQTEYRFTTPADCAFAVLVFRPRANTPTAYSNIMLVDGSTAENFEPYQGQEYEINLGKNLFDKDNMSEMAGYYIDGSGAVVAGSGNYLTWLKLKPDTTYTLTQSVRTSQTVRVGLFPSVITTSSTGTVVGAFLTGATIKQTFTTTSTNYWLAWVYWNGSQSDSGTYTRDMCKNSVQVEAGTQATSYSPYKTPLELAKIGTYQDYIWNDDGTWKIHKEIGKVVLDGTEEWSQTGNGFAFYLSMAGVATFGTDVIPSIRSDYYTASTYRAVAGSGTADYGIATHTSSSRISIRNKDITTVADFKTWLGTHNTTVYYALATPTETEITDSELITQLSTILNTYQGVNNLWLTPSAGAQGELSVHYATGSIDVGAGYEWEEGSGDNSNIVENPGIDRVNPIWKVPGPATNPTLTNITTGQTISWIGSVAAGETLTVDLNNQTAELGGANVFSQLSGDWLALAPGANRLEYSATGATQGCTLEWNGVVG